MTDRALKIYNRIRFVAILLMIGFIVHTTNTTDVEKLDNTKTEITSEVIKEK